MTYVRNLIAKALPFEGLSDATLQALAGASERVFVPSGHIVYDAGSSSGDLFIVEIGAVRLENELKPNRDGGVVHPGEAFGWTALADEAARRNRAVALSPTYLLKLSGTKLLDIVTADEGSGRVSRETVADAIRIIQSAERSSVGSKQSASDGPSRLPAFEGTFFQLSQWLQSPKPYLMFLGYASLLAFWYLSVDVFKLPRFAEMPGLTTVVSEWLSRTPVYGVSIHTPVYYLHILVSIRRIAVAFILATSLGVPAGLLLGWSKIFKEYVFPLFEIVRPIPILAWVPLAIIMFPGSELPVIYLTFLASFFATALNTMLGVRSIDPSLVLAAKCLGASPWQVFWHVVIPGSLPFVFTGLQISVGVGWFSLVAAEMVSGQFGLGYLINTSYTTVQYPTIIIAMITLGVVGYLTSAAVRLAGFWLMGWRNRQLAIGGRT